MFKIIKKYRHLLSRRAADDFNRMAAFLTNICGDQSIDFHRPDEPTAENPPSIRVNKNGLASTAAPPADTANGSAGDSDNFSRGNHSHPINVDTTNNPKDIGTAASNGTATTYARSDHVHRVADNGATKTSLTSGYDGTGGTWTRNTTSWTRGVTKSNGVLCGGTMTFLTRMKQLNSPTGYAQLGWRTVTWDQNGCIISVTDEAANDSKVFTAII